MRGFDTADGSSQFVAGQNTADGRILRQDICKGLAEQPRKSKLTTNWEGAYLMAVHKGAIRDVSRRSRRRQTAPVLLVFGIAQSRGGSVAFEGAYPLVDV